jgi:hypothetical protein
MPSISEFSATFFALTILSPDESCLLVVWRGVAIIIREPLVTMPEEVHEMKKMYAPRCAHRENDRTCT